VNVSTPVGATRAAWLLVRVRLTRLFNQLTSGLQRFRAKSASDGRQATASKSRLGWFVATLVAASMLFSFTNLAHQALSHMQDRLGSTPSAPARSPAMAGNGWLGVQINDLTAAEAKALGWERPRGAKVLSSIPGSPAARAGLLPGDIVVAMDERNVANPGNLMDMIGARPPGTTVQLRLLRGGNTYRLALTVGQRPSPPARAPPNRIRLPPAAGYALAPGVLQACALEALILLLATLLISLASREFAGPDWDLEWLATFPVSFTTLLGVRIVERTVVNPAGLLALWPFLSIVSWECGYRFSAPLLALAVTLPLLVITATIWTVIDTALRLRVTPPKLRNLQAIVSVVSVGFLYLAMSAGLSSGSYVLDWAPKLPAGTLWLPSGLAIGAISSSTPLGMAMSMLSLVVESMVCVALGFVLLNQQLKFGVVGASGRESGRRVANKPARLESEPAGLRALLSPIQTRELRLLGRDRNFMVQTLILPAVIMGGQIFFNAPGSAFALALGNPQHVSAAAFGIAAYALMFSAFQTLNAEGQALWILYTVPHSLEAVLREKALLWGSVCLAYAVAILGLGIAFHPAGSLQQLELMVVVLVGVPIFATIGTSLGVFACDPLAQQVQRRVRPSYVYLYMLLASLYVYSIYASNFWQRAALVVLTALLGLALWQKARDHLPYLLDPTASPPARVSLADGLIAALLFFVLQGVGVLLLSSGAPQLTGRIVLIAFAAAGATTYGAMRFVFWRLKTQGVPRTFDPRPGRAVTWGVAGGSLAAVAAFVYLKLAAHTSVFDNVRETIFTGRDGKLWLALLAIGAAPLFEEFIFRGLIFGGLRRLLGTAPSVLASAAIFALVHPPPAVIPVFGLGMVAAVVYERTGFLLGPIVVHAVYNTAIVTYQSLFF
jgi:ABC-2 type transport system permease protein